ncbi:MAG: hypothetical protein ACI8YQ_004805 [Polaribacter sp.]|jgi:hypothetical protein
MKNRFLLAALTLMLIPKLQSQNLYDIETLRSIYIEFENPDWNSNLIDNWHSQNGERELASLEMDGVTYDSVAIRYKGNATFYWSEETDNPKKPLNIDMNDFIADQDLLGFNKIKLPNSFFDPSALRDVLGFQIYSNYMPTPEANWMKVYIEGEYIGLYPNTESINKQFLKKHFDYKKGPLFKCDPASQFASTTPWESANLDWYGADSTLYYNRYDLKTDNGWAELVNLMDILNNSPEDLESVLNIDRVLWYLATSTVIANYDAYNGFYMHNYYLYLHENGLFQILPWDVSESFYGILLGSGGLGEAGYEWDIFNQDDPFGESRPLVDYVANHPSYRKQYLAHIRTVMEEVLNETELLNTCQDMQAIIADAAADDNNAFFGFGGSYFESNVMVDMNSFGIEVAGIMSTVEKRKLYLESLPEVNLSAPIISQVNRSIQFPQSGEQVAVSALIENGTTVDLRVSTNEYASHFETIEMLDDGMHGDGVSGDGVYGAFIPYMDLDDSIKYYIRAQNSEAMILDPQRAEYEFHEYVVGQVSSTTNIGLDQQDLIVSPNPFFNQISIQFKYGKQGEGIRLQIYSSIGSLIKTQWINLVDEICTLDLEELNSGIYFLKVKGFKPSRIVKF